MYTLNFFQIKTRIDLSPNFNMSLEVMWGPSNKLEYQTKGRGRFFLSFRNKVVPFVYHLGCSLFMPPPPSPCSIPNPPLSGPRRAQRALRVTPSRPATPHRRGHGVTRRRAGSGRLLLDGLTSRTSRQGHPLPARRCPRCPAARGRHSPLSLGEFGCHGP